MINTCTVDVHKIYAMHDTCIGIGMWSNFIIITSEYSSLLLL